jgi:aminoglycoside phosphotransferase (APT) family kinase protein
MLQRANGRKDVSEPLLKTAPPANDEPFAASLLRLSARLFPGAQAIVDLARLSGGASQETWSFDVLLAAEKRPLILRRAPGGYRAPFRSAGLATEAALMLRAGESGVPSPRVLRVLQESDDIGQGFLMDRVEGETIPRKILRDAAFAQLRPRLAFELGTILARIHRMDTQGFSALRKVTARAELAELRQAYENDRWPRPVFEFAFRWLGRHAPDAPEPMTLLHGDFRNGNLIVGPDRVRAVLDWELAHFGDPMEDLGWLCVNSWRFGNIDKPVGGFGAVDELIAGYEAAGTCKADPERIRFWQTLGTLRWGVMCLGMLARYESGEDRSIERAMIARRASETEIDLLRILAPRLTMRP